MFSTKIRTIILALVAAFSFAAASVASAQGPAGEGVAVAVKGKEGKEEAKEGKCKYIHTGPTAALSPVSPANPSTGDTVTFDGSKSRGYFTRCATLSECPETCEFEIESVETYHWNFGDGETQDTKTATVTHAYKTAQTYTVSLTVTSAGRTSKNLAAATVPVADRPPTAAFTPPSRPTTATVSTFNASASADPDGTIASYHWAFGDGVTQNTTQPTIAHTYTRAGGFEVVLTVTDNNGKTGTTQHPISVSAPKGGGGTGSSGGGSTGGAAGGPTGGGANSATASISSSGHVSTSRRGGRILVATGEVVRCPAGFIPCRVTVEAVSHPNGHFASAVHGKKKAARKMIGRATSTVTPGSVGKLTFELNATGAALLHRLRHLGAILTVTVHHGGAKPLMTTRRITVNAPRQGKRKP